MAMCCSPKISLLSAVYTKVRGRLLFGEGASLLSTCQWMTRGQLLVKMGLHGQLLLNFEPVHGLPPARRTTSTTMYWGKNSFLWVSAPLCQSARGGRADRVSPKTIGAMGLCLPQSEKDMRPRGA